MSVIRRTTPPARNNLVMPGPGRFIPASDLQALRRSPLHALLQATARYGDVFQYPVGFWTIYVVNHPAYIQHILQDNQRNYSKDTFQYNLLGLAAGDGLLSSDGPRWLRQRRLAQPAFHRERIAAFADLMANATLRMVERWHDVALRGATIDIDSEMMQLALEIVGKALFQIDLSDRAHALVHSVLAALEHIIARGLNPFALPLRVPTPGNLRFRRAIQTVDHAIYQLIAERRREHTDRGDLLSMLLMARDEDTGEGMTDQQIRDEIITFLIAGHETVASALTWTWYLLAQHTNVEQKLHQELARVLSGRAPTMQDLPGLRYTSMVVDEAMRLYPPGWLMTRRALAEDEIGGYRIPAGALLVISQYAVHRHESFWPDPERFDPERFAPEHAASRPRYAFFPFGGGAHLCIGNQFALMEARIVVATVAQHFRLRMNPGCAVAVSPLVTLRPKHGLHMHLEQRQVNGGK